MQWRTVEQVIPETGRRVPLSDSLRIVARGQLRENPIGTMTARSILR
jgi:hypothetical protein